MKTKKTFGILLLLLCAINFAGCSDNDDKGETAKSSFFAVEVIHGIDAEQKEQIEKDLRNNLPVPAGGGYTMAVDNSITPVRNICTIVDSNIKPITIGTLYLEKESSSKQPSDFPKVDHHTLPENQIVSFMKWTFEFNGKKQTYHTVLEQYYANGSDVRPWLYEDLTDYYKAKYPNAGVKGVTRVQVLTYQPNIKEK